jgi:hypothetical protein
VSDLRPIFPLFPLPAFFLCPGTAVPLHIFEPRYRQMIDDLLDCHGRLVMASVQRAHVTDLAGCPPVFDIGGLGEIVQHRRVADGRYLITVAGLARVRLAEAESDRDYRKVRVEILTDQPEPDPASVSTLRSRLVMALRRRYPGSAEIPVTVGVGRLADLLLHRLPVDEPVMEALYAELDPLRRAEKTLAALAATG